jgi:molybdate transport system substrate-binding protein
MNRRTFLQKSASFTSAAVSTTTASWWAGCRPTATNSTPAPLTVFCAAGLKKPVETAATAFTRVTGIPVQFQFGGSGTLLNQLRVAPQSADLLIAADAGSLADAKRFELTRESLPLATQTPVLAVRSGNPLHLRTLTDLLERPVRFGLANPESASIGKATRRAAGTEWNALMTRAAVMKPTVTEIAADLSLGALEAAILWDSTVAQFQGLEAVAVAELSAQSEQASIAVLAGCAQPVAALQFARFLAAPEQGGMHFRAGGFTHEPGDPWVLKPELILYSGGVNRPAVEKLLRLFSEREGVEITTVFNGCGVLCATMKAMGSSQNPKFPDAYYACDLCFVPPVAEHFPESVLLTETDIGIATPPGNPKHIATLADLARPSLKIGLCNAEQSTLGFMTRGMLQSTGLLEAIAKNVAVEVPTADFLVNQMRTGALDAAIVYRVNVQAASGPAPLEFVPIRHEGAKAVQPFAVRADSPNRHLALRLLDHLKSNRSAFEDAGFRWTGDQPAVRSDRITLPAWLQPK